MSKTEDTFVCLCPECSFPLFSSDIEIDKTKQLRCGLCGWEGKSDQVKSLSTSAWREYLFNPKSEADVPPMPRSVFYMTFSDRIREVMPIMAGFLLKWGAISMNEKDSPHMQRVFKVASMAFIRVVADGLSYPDTVGEAPAEEEESDQLSLELGEGE